MENQVPQTPQVKQTTEEKAAQRTQTIIIAGGIIFLVLLIAAIVLMATFPQVTEVVRDIAIVFVAVETFLIGAALLVLVVQVQMLIRVLQDEIQPLLRSVNETTSTVRGTTQFVSHNLVDPIIKAAGFTAGVRRVADDLLTVIGVARSKPKSTQSNTGGTNGEEA
ncbi:MAG: hypothetical protein JW981_08555 [Anaerolineae bacterium]|nr:hypothetical protein [Anaerolineae bacterium]